jgi:hypothetical protein
MSVSKIDDKDLRLIVSLYEMTQRAAREDADEFTRNEGLNAAAVSSASSPNTD